MLVTLHFFSVILGLKPVFMVPSDGQTDQYQNSLVINENQIAI